MEAAALGERMDALSQACDAASEALAAAATTSATPAASAFRRLADETLLWMQQQQQQQQQQQGDGGDAMAVDGSDSESGAVAWAAGFCAVAASGVVLPPAAPEGATVDAAVRAVAGAMAGAFARLPAGARFSAEARARFQHGSTLAVCALLSLDRLEAVTALLDEMSACKVSLLSLLKPGPHRAPACLRRPINRVHLYLKKRTWAEATMASEALPESSPVNVAATCTYCGAAFRSRNALFRHLRRECPLAPPELGEPAPERPQGKKQPGAAPKAPKRPRDHGDGDGNGRDGDVGTGAPGASAPSVKRARGKQRQPQARGPRAPPIISPAAARVWLGDIPPGMCTAAKLREMLYKMTPPHIPMPHVDKVLRKGYRRRCRRPPPGSSAAGGEGGEQRPLPSQPDNRVEPHPSASPPQPQDGEAQPPPSPPPSAAAAPADAAATKADREWMGYAFICFRDRAEAAEAIAALNGLQYTPDYALSLRWATEPRAKRGGASAGAASSPPAPPMAQDAAAAAATSARTPSLAAGADPPLADQLLPKGFSAAQRAAALHRHSLATGAEATLEALLEHYGAHPRAERRVAGEPVDPALLGSLLGELRGLRWPAARARPGVRSEHYLLLYRGRRNPGFESLATAVWAVMARHEPAYPCTMVAVTKNFEGSPHTDDRDVTHQLALGLGEWAEGGELCVESEVPNQVCVVSTRGCLARVDGRFVHWVRGWRGGDRYSVIFFCTSGDHATAPTTAVLCH